MDEGTLFAESTIHYLLGKRVILLRQKLILTVHTLFCSLKAIIAAEPQVTDP